MDKSFCKSHKHCRRNALARHITDYGTYSAVRQCKAIVKIAAYLSCRLHSCRNIKTIGKTLKMLKASEDWQRGVGIPYAATFLNGERWHDADSLPEVHASSGSEEVYGWQD